MAGIFDEYFEQKRREQAAQTAAKVRLDPMRPEQAAEGVATAKELGVPPGQVLAFQDHFSDLLAQKRATTALTDAPKLSDWLRSDPVNGALAKDDLENLSWWERTFKPGLDLFGSAVGGSVTDSQVGLGLRTGITGAKQMAVSAATVPLVGQQATMLDRLDAYERAAQLDPGLARHEIASALGIDPMSQTAALVADFAMGDADRRQKHIDRTVRMITSNKELMGALVERVRAYEDHMKTTQGRVVNFTDIDDVSGFFDWMGFNVGQAAPYLAATLTASMAAGPVGAIGVGYSMGVGDIQSENLTNGRDPFATDAAGAAVVGGVPYAALELLGPAAAPFRGVSGDVLEGVATGFFQRLGREVPRNMVEEFINEAGQEIIKDYAVQIGGGDDVELNNETLLKWFNAGMAGMAAGGAMSAGQVAVSKATEAEMRAAESAGQTADLLEQVSQQAQASQVRARSPERFKAALDAAGMGDQMVYVPAQGLREFFQARDMPLDAATAEAWGFDLDSFSEMEISGGQVAVPLSNFSANLVGTEAEAWVRENATIDPDELSLSDAQAANAQVQDILDAEFEAMQAEWQAEEESRASEQQVYDDLYSQARSAGQTVEGARGPVSVLTSFYRTMADRLGDDALELYRRLPLRILGPATPEALPLVGVEYDQTSHSAEAIPAEGLAIQLSEGTERITLSKIVADQRERGAGTAYMQRLADYADATGKQIALTPSADFGGSVTRLRQFYKRFGFVENKGRNKDFGTRESMIREPRRELYQGAVPENAVRMWTHGLQRVLSGAASQADMVGMGRPGAVLRSAAGLSDRPLQFMAGKIRKVMREHPEISPDVLQRIAPLVHDPDYILRSATDPDSIIAVPVELPDGRVMVVSIRKDQRDAQGRPINLITSVYLKDDPQWLAREAAAGRMLYAKAGYRSTGQSPNQPGSDSPYVQPRGADLTRSSKKKILTRADVFKSREFDQARRGSIVLPPGGPDGAQTVINLFETADLSTLLHESGHFFLEASDALARDPAAPQQLRDDMAVVREYLGAEEGQAFTTDQHETFARAFEAYVMEGKAPSLALADVFARARAWLLRIYRSITGLNVKITPEIRAVFDRMLATDAEIAQARAEQAASPLFTDRPAGMAEADWRTYQRLARRSREQAEAKLLNRTMERVRREKAAWWKAERAEVRKEVETRLNALPQYRLIEAMANGRWLNEDGAFDAPDLRIDRKALVDQFGPGILGEVSRERFGGKRAIYGDAGMTPAAAAEMFGFSGAPEMVQILQNTTKRVEAINAETDRIMLDRYGDPMTDGTIEQEALDAIHNEQQQQKNVAEARQLATQLGRDTRSMTARLYRQRARLMLGRLTVRDATQSSRFLAAERRAGKEAERAFAKVARGDAGALSAALMAKEQQILNAALYDLSREAQAEVERVRERMRGFDKKSVREKLEGGYIEQIDDLLDRYDFRRRSPGQVTRTERLRDFVDRMIAEGREAELAIDPRMMDEARRVHYSRLPLDEFRGLVDTIDNLDHLGRFKQKLINARKQRDLNETAQAVADRIADNIGTGRIKQESRVRSVLDLIFTADTVLVEMDGGDEFGASYQAIKEDIDAGYVRVDEMQRELSEKLSELFSVYSAKDIRDMKTERHINGTRFVWSKWKAIAAALNTGNPDNMARLLAEDAHPDQRMTREDLDTVLDTLDKRDWDFVQATWDLINSYWPEIEAVTQRRTGVKPGKVEAQQVLTKFGAYRGGYYPIRYDAGYGHAAAMDARTEMDRFMSAGRFAKAQTKHGHTIERKKTGNGRTLNLDMDVAFTHLRDVTRDIALSEAVDNAYRVLNHQLVAQAFMDAGRKNDFDMLNLWLKDVAQGPIVHTDALNMFARIVKNNFTLSRLAFNLKTAALQMTGAAQSAATVGKRNMARAFADYLKRPGEFTREAMEKSEFMRRRQTTFDKDIHDFASDTLVTSPMRGRLGDAADFAARAGFAPLTKVQFYAVDVPTWVAGYRMGMKKFPGDEARAVAFADRMVARAQDSGAMPDRSAVSRGTLSENIRQAEWMKLFTTLQGYMIAKFNRGYLTARQGARDIRSGETVAERFGATANMATNLMLIYVAEAVMMGLLYAAAASLGGDDEELDGEKFFTWLAVESGGAVVGGLPIIRDAWSVLSMPYATSGGVYGSVTEVPSRIVQQARQGELDAGLLRAVGDAVGLISGFPTTATLRPIEEMMDEAGNGSWFEALMGRNPLAD